MRKMTFIPLAIGLAVALQPAAHAQFGSGIVLDPTQSAHAIVQIGNEEKSIANEAEQIAQGQQIFTNTVKISYAFHESTREVFTIRSSDGSLSAHWRMVGFNTRGHRKQEV